jgi:DNA-3-methyladenine glycosylase II
MSRDPGVKDDQQPVEGLRRADPTLARLIDRLEPVDLASWRKRWALDPLRALARSIVGQQIATSAANAIFGRLQALIAERDPARAIVDATDPDLRAVGPSGAKAAALRISPRGRWTDDSRSTASRP